ncbi:MAG: hypothetical protein SynsKO_15310 [Synoicihabitans sp.]
MDLSEVTGGLGDHVRDSVVITEAEPVDLPGPRLVWVNKAFTEMTGYSAEEAIGQTPRLLQGEDTDPEVRARIRVALKAWQPVREVLKNYTKDGTPFWVELDIKPIADDTGYFHFWVAVQRDVTVQVAHQESLKQARDEAEAANRLKSEFLANMSHEIRTPLNGALGMAQVLSRTQLDTRQREAVQDIISSGQSLLGLIEDVLDISRIEAGHLLLEPGPTRGIDLITAAEQAVRGVATQKGLSLRIEKGPGSDVPFLGDERRLKQVLINLVGNAAKFTDEGEIVLTSAIENDQVIFTVRDTGPGIPVASREAIFDRFYQVDSSSTRHQGGAGLGLTIVKKIVEESDGVIQVGEAPEGGAEFTVSIPFQAAGEKPTPALATHVSSGTNLTRSRRALVIEDNVINLTIVKEALELSDWIVETADLAEPGLAKWRGGEFDLVIMDRQMPGMNGEEAIRVMRSEEQKSRATPTPVLMLTANAMVGTDQAAREAGADAFLTKPFNIADLTRVADQLTAT